MARYLGGLLTADESQVLPSDNYESTSGNAVFTSDEQYLLNISNRWPTVGNSLPRGLFAGGYTSAGSGVTDTINYITITTTSNTTDFGDLSVARWLGSATSNSTRGLTFPGQVATGTGYVDVIDYVTIASTGNATDFGDTSYSG